MPCEGAKKVRATKHQRTRLSKIFKLKPAERAKAVQLLTAADAGVYKNMLERKKSNVKSAQQCRRNKQEEHEKLLIKNQLLYTLAESMAVETDELKRQMQALREHTSCIVASLVHAFGVGIVQEALKDKSHWFQDRDPEDLDCF